LAHIKAERVGEEWHTYGRFLGSWTNMGIFAETDVLSDWAVTIGAPDVVPRLYMYAPPNSVVINAGHIFKSSTVVHGPYDPGINLNPDIAFVNEDEIVLGRMRGKDASGAFAVDGVIYDDGNPSNDREWKDTGIDYTTGGGYKPMVLKDSTQVSGPSVSDYRDLDSEFLFYKMSVSGWPTYQGSMVDDGDITILPTKWVDLGESPLIDNGSMISVNTGIMVDNKKRLYACGTGLSGLMNGGTIAEIELWDRPTPPTAPGGDVVVGEVDVPAKSDSPVTTHVVRDKPDRGYELIQRAMQSELMKSGGDARNDFQGLSAVFYSLLLQGIPGLIGLILPPPPTD